MRSVVSFWSLVYEVISSTYNTRKQEHTSGKGMRRWRGKVKEGLCVLVLLVVVPRLSGPCAWVMWKKWLLMTLWLHVGVPFGLDVRQKDLTNCSLLWIVRGGIM